MAQTYDYLYRMSAPGGHIRIRIRVYREGEQTICLATQRHDVSGEAVLAARTPELATQVEAWHHPARDGRFLWLEQEEYPGDDGPDGAREVFTVVSFRDDGGALEEVRRLPIARAAVEALIGQPVGD